MDAQAKRTIVATLLCIGILVAWMRVQEALYPPAPRPPASSAPAEPAARAALPPPGPVASSHPSGPDLPPLSGDRTLVAAPLQATDAAAAEPVQLGDDRARSPKALAPNPYEFSVLVSPIGGGVESIRLASYRNNVARDPRRPDHDPYDLLQPVVDAASHARYASFVTEGVRLVEDKLDVDLSRVRWTLRKASDDEGESAILTTEVRRGTERVLDVSKVFRLRRGSHCLEISLELKNRTSRPQTVVLTQGGPLGLRNEDPQRESRTIVSAVISPQLSPKGEPVVADGEYASRSQVVAAPEARLDLAVADDQRSLWVAAGNKYFAALMAWLPAEGSGRHYPDYLVKTICRARRPAGADSADLSLPSDLTFEQMLRPPAPIPPGGMVRMRCECYCGPKSDRVLATLPPESARRQYHRVSNLDRAGSCFLPIAPITNLMLLLLGGVYRVVHNYGVAIIILVLVVRFILHPVSRRGQVGMMRMQKGMAQLKPKIDLLQQQYKNDRKKLSEETMRLYREEGINPAASMMGCLPMVLQMPIWIALWTSLNTNVDLRHQPFFFWIRDLSAPDGLYTPATPWNLNIPLLGAMTGPIHGFNLLPIIMTLTMYLQQKLTQKLTRPATPPPPAVDAEGRPIPDQMAQQQKIMNFMMVFFGFMFYNFPSGLNLYILSSNLLGMFEQYLIRKNIREKEARGEFELRRRPAAAEPRPRGQSLLARMQKQIEDMRLEKPGRSGHGDRKPRKQLRS
jgi:YidC/Oxa1 family membrane protein insertase